MPPGFILVTCPASSVARSGLRNGIANSGHAPIRFEGGAQSEGR